MFPYARYMLTTRLTYPDPPRRCQASIEIIKERPVTALLRALSAVVTESSLGGRRSRTIKRPLWINAYAAASQARHGDSAAAVSSVRSGTQQWSSLLSETTLLNASSERLEHEFVSLLLAEDDLLASGCHKLWKQIETLKNAPLTLETAEQLGQAEMAWRESWTAVLQSS